LVHVSSVLNHTLMSLLFSLLFTLLFSLLFSLSILSLSDSAWPWKDTWFSCFLLWTTPLCPDYSVSWTYFLILLSHRKTVGSFVFCSEQFLWLFCLTAFHLLILLCLDKHLVPVTSNLNHPLMYWLFSLLDIYSFTIWFCFLLETHFVAVSSLHRETLGPWVFFSEPSPKFQIILSNLTLFRSLSDFAFPEKNTCFLCLLFLTIP